MTAKLPATKSSFGVTEFQRWNIWNFGKISFIQKYRICSLPTCAIFNSQAMQLIAQCTLQKTHDWNGCSLFCMLWQWL